MRKYNSFYKIYLLSLSMHSFVTIYIHIYNVPTIYWLILTDINNGCTYMILLDPPPPPPPFPSPFPSPPLPSPPHPHPRCDYGSCYFLLAII